MRTRMVPQIVASPGRVVVVDAEGCLSLEVETRREGGDLVASIRDLELPGQQEPREARFYSVSDRSLFVKALLDDRLEMLARLPGRPRSYVFRPRLVRA